MCRLRRSARTAHQTSVRMRPSTRQNRSPRWKKSEKSRASWSLGIPFLATIDEHGQVVPVDVVSGDDVGIELVDELDETLHDLPLVPLEDAGLDFAGFPVYDADAEDVPVLDAVLDVEAQHAERGTEGIACLETIRDQKQVGRVFP